MPLKQLLDRCHAQEAELQMLRTRTEEMKSSIAKKDEELTQLKTAVGALVASDRRMLMVWPGGFHQATSVTTRIVGEPVRVAVPEIDELHQQEEVAGLQRRIESLLKSLQNTEAWTIMTSESNNSLKRQNEELSHENERLRKDAEDLRTSLKDAIRRILECQEVNRRLSDTSNESSTTPESTVNDPTYRALTSLSLPPEQQLVFSPLIALLHATGENLAKAETQNKILSHALDVEKAARAEAENSLMVAVQGRDAARQEMEQMKQQIAAIIKDK
ncbi:hypothetical protein HYDPIDRAFT_32038 [Hydnomerulius pinastri MD-312]|uniref:Unplaced genomic scaffold scaffold_36, whole genome shotgun sequence n=1 Tax=Hydnomerulius pinastri MD-312 TaxID=994086 RepID=A0A0C9V500_9AGAM|nr:hypothetical protein HYDPIDRAFT_32038 [Hydnomerulius pinastri MD-312]